MFDDLAQSMSRRRYFRYLVSLTAAGLALPPTGIAVAQVSEYPFGLGVASGSPASDGFVIWTRLVSNEPMPDLPVVVAWEVCETEAPYRVVSQGIVRALPELGHSVHVEVVGLLPDRWYSYRFRVDGFESEVGRSRTLPAVSKEVLHWRLAYASCQRWEDGYYAAYRQMLADAPDLVLFLGDYIYEAASRKQSAAVRIHSHGRVRDLQGYRNRYALYRSDHDLQRMHASCPWVIVWDDHEVQDNYAGLLSTHGTANLPALRLAAYQAFYEHMPIRRSSWLQGWGQELVGGELRLYGRYDIGKLARLHLLDNRQYRDRPLCGEAPAKSLAAVCNDEPSETHSMLGLQQERWLEEGLTEAAAMGSCWNIVAQQTRLTPRNYKQGLGVGYSVDTWDGYPLARQRMLDALQRSGAANPIVLGGDIHHNWVARVHSDPYDNQSTVLASEFCGTSITSRSNTTQSATRRAAQANPHCVLAESRHRGYGLVDLWPHKIDVKLQAVDDVKLASARTSALAEFRVLAGSHEILRL